jgi:hypothetical protein
LILTAHHSLGYQPPTTPLSPEDDSIKQAWRSASQTCLDIPDGNTISPSPGTKRRRMQSCPDVLEMGIKYSPPTPPTSSPTRRMRPARAGRQIHQLLGDVADQDGSLPVFPRTPIFSPTYGGLGPPLIVFQRNEGNRTTIFNEVPLPTPPTSSPLGSSRTVIIPHITPTPNEPRITGEQLPITPTSKSRKAGKPLSLRSRLKLAARRSIVVA